MALRMMASEREGHTLEPTALVHEVWIRLLESRNAADLSRGEFLGLAAQAMRRILTDHGRRAGAAKRGAHPRRTTLSGKLQASTPESLAIDLDEALGALARLDPESAQVAELRFYGDCSTEDVAEALGVSPRSIKRRWRFARAWLHRYISKELR